MRRVPDEPSPANVDAHVAELARIVRARLASRDRLVVGVAGESGSGKSTTALHLVAALVASGTACVVLHQDDYFRRPPRTNHEHRVADLSSVGPHEVDLARLAAHVAAYRAGEDAVGLAVDYPGNRFTERRLALAAARVLVVEGTYVLGLPDLDLRVFLTATHHDTLDRRRTRARDVDAPIIDRILAIEHALIAPQAALADILIDRDFRLVRQR